MKSLEKIHVRFNDDDAGKWTKAYCGKRFPYHDMISLSNSGLLLHKTEMCQMCKKAIIKKLKHELKGETS